MESYLWKFYNLSWSSTGQREVRGQAALIDGFADTQSSRESETDSVQGTRFVALGWTQHKICKNKEKDVNLLNIFNLIKYAAAKKNYYKSGLCNIIQKHGISISCIQ